MWFFAQMWTKKIDRHATSLLLPRFDRRDEKRNNNQKINETIKLVLIKQENRKPEDCNCEDEDTSTRTPIYYLLSINAA